MGVFRNLFKMFQLILGLLGQQHYLGYLNTLDLRVYSRSLRIYRSLSDQVTAITDQLEQMFAEQLLALKMNCSRVGSHVSFDGSVTLD